MIIAALSELYERVRDRNASELAAYGYSQEKISYEIVLGPDGCVVAVGDLRDTSGKKPKPRLLSVPQPEKRTVSIQPNFLWDKTSYALGVSATSKRTEREHQAFKAWHRELLRGASDVGLETFLAFLDQWTPERFCPPLFNDEMRDANLVFRLDGERQYLHDRPAARALRTRALELQQDGQSAVCLVTGSRSPIARLHPSIKGVNGSQSAGASIVSFNLESFCSYGKTQGYNAPVSEEVAFRYTTMLNHLLRRDPHNRQRLQIGDATVVLWAQAALPEQAEAAEDLLSSFLDQRSDDSQEARKLRMALQCVSDGRPMRELDPRLDEGTRIFVLGLSPNASRLSIRFWCEETLGRFARRLAEHFQDLRLEPSPWRTPPPVWKLVLATAPSRNGKASSEDVSPLLAGELMRAILTGSRYPGSLLTNILMRMRADGDLSGARVALCKGVMARSRRLGVRDTEEVPVSLDQECRNPGYVLGRLFSVMEAIQQEALGKSVNATIRDRYYGAASATPASVFPVLLRGTQHHLSRVRKNKPGLAVNFEKELGHIFDQLDAKFPRSLPIEAQGHFAIGYYHQTQARFARVTQDDAEETESKEGEPA